MATSFSYYRDDTLKFAPSDLRVSLTTLLKNLPSPNIGFLSDSLWTKSKSVQWNIKCSEENLKFIKETIQGTVKGDEYLILLNGYKIKFKKSGKKTAAGGIDAVSTKKQELGSLWVIKRVLLDNINYSVFQDILKDPKYPELLALYPEVDEIWLNVFFLQQKKIKEKLTGHRFNHFSREEGFMKYISDIVKSKYGITKKDNWNPADIWLVKDELTIKTKISNIINSDKKGTLSELNTVLRTMFSEKKVIGISLKKVSGAEAKWEEVNVKHPVFEDKQNYNFSVVSMKVNLNIVKLNTIYSFKSKASDIKVDGADYGTISFQIQGNQLTTFDNLKFEATGSASSSARMGKAPVDMVVNALKDFGIIYSNSNMLYPKSSTEFLKPSTLDKYSKMFTALKNSGRIDGDMTLIKFKENMVLMFNSKTPYSATSKLMQMSFIYGLNTLSKEKLDTLVTDICFLSMKKGERFGPFVKLH